MSLIIPSYKAGFACNAAESEHPGLWDGLAGLWAPSLGPTGLALRDQSGFGNHGTLTSMDPATDWVATKEGHALDFDGDEHIDLGINLVLSLPVSFAACVLIHNLTSGAAIIDTDPHVNTYYGFLLSVLSTGKLVTQIGNGTGGSSANRRSKISDTGVSIGMWYTLVGVIRGLADHSLYINGVDAGGTHSGSGGAVAHSGTNSAIGKRDLGAYLDGRLASALIYDRILTPNEIQQLYVDPHALLRLRRRVFAASAPVGVAPTSHLYGPLVGPLGGAV